MRAPAPSTQPAIAAEPAVGHFAGELGSARSYGSDTGERQQQVWDRVRKIQDGLSSNLGAPVNAPASQSSLQLALENEKLKGAQDAYLKVLSQEGEKDGDVIGYVFAINGKLNSAEVYPSNGLFRKMWPKLLKASVTEAIGQKNAGNDSAPTSDKALAFLDEARKGTASEKLLPANVRLETRQAENAFYFETRRADGNLGASQLSGEVAPANRPAKGPSWELPRWAFYVPAGPKNEQLEHPQIQLTRRLSWRAASARTLPTNELKKARNASRKACKRTA